MAKLYFRYGAMGSSKSANILMVRYNYEERGQYAVLLKPRTDNRDGEHEIKSRIGLEAPAEYVDEFLKEISPSIAVISCGYKNDYGHPHRSTLQNLESVNAKVFRTDVNGSMQFYSDGNKIYSTIKYKQE